MFTLGDSLGSALGDYSHTNNAFVQQIGVIMRAGFRRSGRLLIKSFV